MTDVEESCHAIARDGTKCDKPRNHRKAEHTGLAVGGVRRYWRGYGTEKSPSWWTLRDPSQNTSGDQSEAMFLIESRHGI